jgi:hypothetical protein
VHLLALHCCFCNHWSCVKLKLTAVALPVVVYSTAAAAAGSALRGCRCDSLTHAAASPERATACGFDFAHPPPPPKPVCRVWAGWWPWRISTPPRPVREAREDGGERQPRGLTALDVTISVQVQPDQDSH